MSASISILAEDLHATATLVIRHRLHGLVWCTTRRERTFIAGVELPYPRVLPASLVAFRDRVLVGLRSQSSSSPEVALAFEPKTGRCEELARFDTFGELRYAAWQ